MKIRPKNWPDFQHYKDRAPPWIKLHKGLLDNFEYQCLPVASRALAPMLWLLASEHSDGEIDATPDKLAFRLRMSAQEVIDALKPLIDSNFFEILDGDSSLLAERKRTAMPERETEAETEAEREAERESTRKRGSASASRLPADWAPGPEDAKFCQTERPDLSILDTAARFRDYWHAQPGAKGRKLDWPATWRNWVRNERAPARASPQSASQKRTAWGDALTQTLDNLTGTTPAPETFDAHTGRPI